jgi:hypothetical protein
MVPQPSTSSHLRRASVWQREHARVLKGRKFFLLFLFLLSLLILYPMAQLHAAFYVAFRTLAAAVTLVSIYALSLKRSLLGVVLLLSIPSITERILLPRVTDGFLSVLNVTLSFVFDVFIIVVIFRRVFSNVRPNSETIFGALCIYLMVGFSFASLYGMLATVTPKAFFLDPQLNDHAVVDRFDFIYFSFGTLTSLGAPGIIAVSSHARSITAIESILGVLYLAVSISRLVGAYRLAPPADET